MLFQVIQVTHLSHYDYTEICCRIDYVFMFLYYIIYCYDAWFIKTQAECW